MNDGILYQWLNEQLLNDQMSGRRRQTDFIIQLFPKPELLNMQVLFHLLHIFFKADFLALRIDIVAHDITQISYHAADIPLTADDQGHVDVFQCIIDEMRTDLRLKRRQFCG